MAADRQEDLRRWLDLLHTGAEDNPTHRELHSAAVQLLGAIERCEPSTYRDMALCKLADLVPLGYIAGRQSTQGETT